MKVRIARIIRTFNRVVRIVNSMLRIVTRMVNIVTMIIMIVKVSHQNSLDNPYDSQDSQLDYQGNTWVIFALKDKLRSISNKSTILTISINSSNSTNPTNATNLTNSTILNNFNQCSKFIQFKQFHAAIASVLFYRLVLHPTPFRLNLE